MQAWCHIIEQIFLFCISLGKYKLSQIWSSLTYFVSSALCFLSKITYLLTIIIMESKAKNKPFCDILCEDLFVGEKLSCSSFLCFNERIFNPITKRTAYWRKLPLINFSVNGRITAMNLPSLIVGKGENHLIGETGNWGELDIHWDIVARGYGCTEIKGLAWPSHIFELAFRIMYCCCFFTFLHMMNMKDRLSPVWWEAFCSLASLMGLSTQMWAIGDPQPRRSERRGKTPLCSPATPMRVCWLRLRN